MQCAGPSPEVRHIKRVRAPTHALADPDVAEDAERLARQFRPRWRRRDAERPLALPLPATERGVEPREAARQRQDRPEHVLRNADLVAVGIRQPRAVRKGGPIDPVEAGAGYLHKFESSGRWRCLERRIACWAADENPMRSRSSPRRGTEESTESAGCRYSRTGAITRWAVAPIPCCSFAASAPARCEIPRSSAG